MAAPPDPAVQPLPVPFATAARYWLRLGCTSFGGPAGQIALMHLELVERRRWISEHRFLHALNYTMVLPGPEAQQLATYMGWLMHGTAGGLVAGGLFVLPSLVLMTLLAWIYLVHHDLALVSGAFSGVKPAVVAIVLAAAHRLGTRSLTTTFKRVLALAAFLAIALGGVAFPWIIGVAAASGALVSLWRPAWLKGGQRPPPAVHPSGPALIDDAMPVPPHARFALGRLLTVVCTGLLVWGASIAALVAVCGPDTLYPAMAWFFTKAALLTFGGAYAVLPYVFQGAVEHHGWATASQMIDGLALGETTPGPLIMIVAFVGFIGGWNGAGAGSPLIAGSAGALVATVFTFLPSFLFIFAGAPLVEATRHEIRIAAPLSAITAAVVGVVANLGLFFAGHVFWPHGLEGPPDLMALALACAAAVALFRYRAGVVTVVLASAGAGALLSLAGLAP